MVLYGSSFINLIFAFRGLAAALAHAGSHCVTGIALSPVDATSLFFSFLSLLWPLRESTKDYRKQLQCWVLCFEGSCCKPFPAVGLVAIHSAGSSAGNRSSPVISLHIRRVSFFLSSVHNQTDPNNIFR
jgi:hypothetical protein